MSADLPTREVDAVVYWFGATQLRPQGLVTSEGDNRWNEPGDAVVYFAGDLGVGLVEAGRHVQVGGPDGVERTAWAVPLRMDALVDLRDPDVREALGLRDRYWFLDRQRCQRISGRLRRSGNRGIVVPSAGFPDDPQRWNLVSFDTHPDSLARLVHEARAVGRLTVQGTFDVSRPGPAG